MQTLNHLAAEFHRLAREKGWYEGGVNVPEKLLMIHSETSEVVNVYREHGMLEWTAESGKPEGVRFELIDILIRTLDLCGALELNVDEAIAKKFEFNKTRPHRHGNKLI